MKLLIIFVLLLIIFLVCIFKKENFSVTSDTECNEIDLPSDLQGEYLKISRGAIISSNHRSLSLNPIGLYKKENDYRYTRLNRRFNSKIFKYPRSSGGNWGYGVDNVVTTHWAIPTNNSTSPVGVSLAINPDFRRSPWNGRGGNLVIEQYTPPTKIPTCYQVTCSANINIQSGELNLNGPYKISNDKIAGRYVYKKHNQENIQIYFESVNNMWWCGIPNVRSLFKRPGNIDLIPPNNGWVQFDNSLPNGITFSLSEKTSSVYSPDPDCQTKNQWKCINGISAFPNYTPIRKANNGNIECLSSNGRDCSWHNNKQACDNAARNADNTSNSLSCDSNATYPSNHWCYNGDRYYNNCQTINSDSDSVVSSQLSNGITVVYYDYNTNGLGGYISKEEIQEPINFQFNNIVGNSQRETAVANYQGYIKAPIDGFIKFKVTVDDGVIFRFDDSVVFNEWREQTVTSFEKVYGYVEADTLYKFDLLYYNGVGTGTLKLEWSYFETRILTPPNTASFTPFSIIPADKYYINPEIKLYTACTEGRYSQSSYMDRHNFNCSPNNDNHGMLTGFELGNDGCINNSSNININYEYSCRNIPNNNVQTHHTSCQLIDDTNAEYLDRHDVGTACGENQALKESILTGNGCQTGSPESHRYMYKCANSELLGDVVNRYSKCKRMRGEYIGAAFENLKVKCKDDEVMKSYRLIGDCGDPDPALQAHPRYYRYKYSCAKINNESQPVRRVSLECPSLEQRTVNFNITADSRRFLNTIRKNSDGKYIVDDKYIDMEPTTPTN